MRKVLVAGGGGYIGSVLCEELLKKGYQVTCLDRFFFGKNVVGHLQDQKNFTFVQDDIRSVKDSVVKDHDALIDVSGISNDPSCELDPHLTEDINYKGSVRLCQIAKDKGIKRYLFSSSCSVYGFGQDLDLTEESSLNPVSLYARTKIQAEKEILKLGSKEFSVTILRNATVYGMSPRMRFDLLVNMMTARAVTQRKIFVMGGGKQWRPNIHVRDVSKAFYMVMEAPQDKVSGQIFNVGDNEQNFQVIQMAHLIREVIPFIEIDIVPDDPDKRTYNVNFDKIQKVLGFKAEYSLNKGVAEIKQAIERAEVDTDDPRTVTLKYYKYLLDADRILNDIKLGGKVF